MKPLLAAINDGEVYKLTAPTGKPVGAVRARLSPVNTDINYHSFGLTASSYLFSDSNILVVSDDSQLI